MKIREDQRSAVKALLFSATEHRLLHIDVRRAMLKYFLALENVSVAYICGL